MPPVPPGGFPWSDRDPCGERGIRVNVWRPARSGPPSTMEPDKVAQFGSNTPLGRPGQPVELAPVYVLLASDEASYVSGARVAVTGGRPIL
jgi:NAD(P)-dependent dehydrogenase (short-subunit alcohol dehydrogenase family)